MEALSCDIVYNNYNGVVSVSFHPKRSSKKPMHDDKPDLISPLADDPTGARIRLGTRMKTTEPVYWMIEDPRHPAANLAIVGGENMGNTQMVHSVAIQELILNFL